MLTITTSGQTALFSTKCESDSRDCERESRDLIGTAATGGEWNSEFLNADMTGKKG